MIKVLLADDHAMFREGLRVLLNNDPQIEVVAQASNGREASEFCTQLQPDLALLDINMREMSGIDAARALQKHSPHTRIIALTVHSDRRYVEGMLNAGAAGFVLKECAFEELHQAIETVLSGECYVSPRLSTLMVSDFVRRTSSAVLQREALSDREISVLRAIAEGCSNKEIATRLIISVKTVESHRHNLMNKLELHTVADLTKYAIREGLVEV